MNNDINPYPAMYICKRQQSCHQEDNHFIPMCRYRFNHTVRQKNLHDAEKMTFKKLNCAAYASLRRGGAGIRSKRKAKKIIIESVS